jgi:hypothetical protein
VSISDQIEVRLNEIQDNQLVGERRDEAGNLVCYYCGQPIGKYSTHRDHITPKSRGGLNQYWNIALSCADCNIRKSVKPPAVFLAQLPDDLQVDFLARLVIGGALAQRLFVPNSPALPATPSRLDIVDNLEILALQLQQMTEWMREIQQEVINLGESR